MKKKCRTAIPGIEATCQQDYFASLNEEREALFGIIQFHGEPDVIGINSGKPFDYSDLISAEFERLYDLTALARDSEQKAAAKRVLLDCVNALVEKAAHNNTVIV